MPRRRLLQNETVTRIADVGSGDLVVRARRADCVYCDDFVIVGLCGVLRSAIEEPGHSSSYRLEKSLRATRCTSPDLVTLDASATSIRFRPGESYSIGNSPLGN